MKLLEKHVEVRNGRKVVVFKPNPKISREESLKRLEELMKEAVSKTRKTAA